MVVKTEKNHAGEACLWEVGGLYARKRITLLTGNSVESGQVLAKVTKAAAAVAAAVAGNAGNGAFGAVVLSDGYKLGVYRVTFIEPGADAGDFIVEDPEGIQVGAGEVGVEFDAGGLTFTIADGGNDFAAGDSFTVTISEGSGKYVPLDQDAIDGSEVACAVAYDAIDAGAADADGVAWVRGPCVMDANVLVWPDDIDANEKAAAILQLEEVGILVR